MLEGFVNGSLFGERHGSGSPTVVALHGWQRTHRDFAAVFGSGERSAIALDLPGFGASPPPPQPWGSAAYAAALAPLFEELDGPVVILGHSFGGRVAIHLALTVPHAVRALCLTGVPQLDPSPPGGRVSRQYRAVRMARRLGLVGEARLERARERHGSRDYREAEGVLRGVLVAVLAERYAPMLPALSLPVELVWGSADTAAPLAGAEYAAKVLPDGHLEVLEGIGHMTPLEAPAALAAALDRLDR